MNARLPTTDAKLETRQSYRLAKKWPRFCERCPKVDNCFRHWREFGRLTGICYSSNDAEPSASAGSPRIATDTLGQSGRKPRLSRTLRNAKSRTEQRGRSSCLFKKSTSETAAVGRIRTQNYSAGNSESDEHAECSKRSRALKQNLKCEGASIC